MHFTLNHRSSSAGREDVDYSHSRHLLSTLRIRHRLVKRGHPVGPLNTIVSSEHYLENKSSSFLNSSRTVGKEYHPFVDKKPWTHVDINDIWGVARGCEIGRAKYSQSPS